ncbi:flagellar hook assembly protein FlgD [uncultured Propionivibrio sp.]|uniref:flagellar hook assembly protein FlgD n=1 Tax=uncultured Propionivibrio sp. TaxID=426737 RepID=UPI0029C072F4|nr:flagellar hook assembly protein FlgD [uncultured Propionivibrio sp.]
MSTVQSTSTSSAADIFASINAAGKSSSTTTSAVDEQQNRFLKLLVTQLRNQDPLNPMDNAEFTSQLAQINTVTGIEKLNTTLSSLVTSLASTQAEQAATMIGKHVMVPGSELTLSSGAAYGAINLDGKADSVTVSILDSKGNVVKTEDLGAQSAGVVDFAWDGKIDSETTAPDGTYTFKVDAKQGTTAVGAKTLQLGTVSALVRTSTGFQLDLGSLGKVDFTNVYQVL